MPEKDYVIVRNGESQSYSADDFNSPEIQQWLGENKDAESYEVSAYNPQDETLDGDSFQIYNPKGEFENYTREDIESPEMQEWIKANPTFRVARVRPAGPWGEGIRKQFSNQRAIENLKGEQDANITDEQRAALETKRQRIAELEAELENYNKKAKEELDAIPGQLDRQMKLPAQERKRSEIRKQLQEAERAYFTDPIVLGENERGRQHAEMANEELDKVYSGIQAQKETKVQQPLSFGGSSTALGGAPAFYGEDEDQKMYNAARRLNDATIKLREAPSKYDAVGGPGHKQSSGFNNFMQGAKDRVSEADFWTLGLTGIQDQLQLKGVFDKIRTELGGMREITEANIDETLSPMEKQLLAAFFRNADAQAARANDLSRGYQAGQSAADSLQFMAQFALSGAVAGAAAKALSKSSVSSMSEWIAKAIAKEGAGAFRQGAGKLVGDIAESAVSAIFQPGTYKSALESMNQLDENGEVVNQSKAFWKGLADYGIEVFSERTGDYIPNVLGAIAKGTKIGNLTKRLANTELGKWGSAFFNSDALRMLKAGGWNGYFGEMSEEFIGAALRSVTGIDPDAWKEQWDKDNLAVMALSFLPMSIFGGTINTVKYGVARKNFADTQEDLRGRLQELGFSEDQIAHAMDATRLSSPEKIRETLKPIVDEMANRGAFKDDQDALMDYAMAAATLNAYDGYENARVQQERDAKRDELSQIYGDFWKGNEKDGRTVQRVTLPDGKTGFVIGTDETGLMSVRWDDGSMSFTDTEHGAQVEESTLDSYLDSQILLDTQARDAAQMQEEAAVARQQFDNNIAQNAGVPMGTPERQEMGKLALQTDPNTGATTPVRDANGNYMVVTMNGQVPVSENDLAAKWGISLQPKTQEQKEADAVAAYEASKKRVDAYNAIPQGSEVEANLEGLDEPVKYQFTRAVINDESGEVEIKVWDEENQREETLPESAFPDLQQAAAEVSARQPAEQEQTPAEAPAETPAETPAEDNTPRDFRGNPLPMKSDGRVDQGSLWTRDPEAWAAWNDQQRQDGGANTRAYVQAAASKVQGEISKAQKEYAKELDFDRREAIEQQIAEKTKRLNILNSILGGYKSREEAAENRTALDSITTDDSEIVAGRTFAEAKKYVQDSIKQLEWLKEKMPEASDEIDAKLLNLGELAGMMDTVEQTLPEITAPQTEEIDLEPRTPLELAAWLFANGKIKITHEAFAKELGLRGKGGKGMSREAKNFLAILRKDGMSIETAGERLEEAVRENQIGDVTPLPDEVNAGRDVIIELLSRVNSYGEIKKFIENEHRAQAEEDRKAQLRMIEDAVQADHGISFENYTRHLDALRKNMLLQILGLPTENINFEENNEQENGRQASGGEVRQETETGERTDGPVAGPEGSEEEPADTGAGEEVMPGEVSGVSVAGESEGAGERGVPGDDIVFPVSGEAGGGESSAAESGEVEDLPSDAEFAAAGLLPSFDRTIPANADEAKSIIRIIVQFAKNLTNQVRRAVIGGVTERQQQDFAANNIPADGRFVHSIENSAIAHNQKQHGDSKKEAREGQIAITESDYELIPDILENYDTVALSSRKNGVGNEVIVYTKTYPDGTIYYLEEIRKGRNSLAFQTMYKKKSGSGSSDGLMQVPASPSTPVAPSDNSTSVSDSKDSENSVNASTSVENNNPVVEAAHKPTEHTTVPYHPDNLRKAYESGDKARIAEAETAMADYINSSTSITLLKGSERQAKNRRLTAAKGSAEYKTQDFVAKATAKRLKELDKILPKVNGLAASKAYDAARKTYGNRWNASVEELRQAIAYYEQELNTAQQELAATGIGNDESTEDMYVLGLRGRVAMATAFLNGLNGELRAKTGELTEAQAKSLAFVSGKTEEQIREEQEQRRQQPLRDRIKEWEERTGQEIEVIGSFDEIKEQSVRMQVYGDRTVKGWFNPSTNKVVVYLPNTTDISDIDKTYLHEIISHKGLRELLGQDGFNVLMDHVYSDVMTDADRQRYAEYNRHLRDGSMSDEQLRRADADEYVARLAEDMDADPSAWQKFVALFKEALMKLGMNIQLTDQDLSALLHASLARYETMQRAAREQERARMEAQQQRNEDAAAFVAGERTKAADTNAAEKNPQVPISETQEKYEDFGEKIGWAKKDLAKRGYTQKKGEGDARPAWRKKYEAANITELSESDKAMARRMGLRTDFTLVPKDILEKGPDYSKPFVGYYVQKSKSKYGRDRTRFITDETGKPIIFTSQDQYEATIPVFEAKDQGYRVRQDGDKFKIVRPASNGKMVEYAEFDSREDAVSYLASPEGCTDLLNRKRENYELPALEDLTRNNMPDYRNGRNITPDDFQKMFKFRGGEFGNWNNAAERQQALNYAYDALMDLAMVLRVTPESLSLNGELSIAFGARGEGGARAHYEPTKAVINLTKMKGAGSLAHEWAHALDNYFGLMDAKQTRNREEDVPENALFLSEGSSWKKGARQEVRDAFAAVMKAIKEKSVTRQIALDKAQKEYDDMIGYARRQLQRQYREEFARGITKYQYNRKTKQRDVVKIVPTEEQLVEYDRLSSLLENDPTFKFDWDYTKSAYRASGDVAKQLYDLVKDVMPNRGGEKYGPLHNAFYYLDKALPLRERLEKAKAGETETVSIPTTILEDSRWFDRMRAGEYYAKDIEMFARAFENYVSGEMRGEGQSSDYLTYEKGPLYQEIWDHNPYPAGEERAAVKMAFDHLFDVLQEKVDEQTGRTMFFRKDGFAAREGNVYFRKGRSLVGMHNISENKLAKAMKTGGLANPSAAVVDIARQNHEDYGEISLIMPSSLVDSETGRNIGTFLGDAWTPTYPGTQKIISDAGWDKLFEDLRSLPDEVRSKIRLDYDLYLEDDRMADSIKWWFLHDTGRKPEIVKHESGLPEETRNFILSLGERGDEAIENDREVFDRVADLFRQMSSDEEIKKAETKLEPREGASEFVKRRIDARNAGIDKYGIAPANIFQFFNQLHRQLRQDGSVNEYETFDRAARFIESENLQEEFQEWLDARDERYDAETKLFAGWTNDGEKKWLANTVENASRLMNGEPQQNAYGNGGLSATRANLVQRMRTLADIRRHKDLLVTPEEYDERYKELEDELFAAIQNLADRQKISDNQFSNIDYAEARLQEALPMRSPAAYLNAEYGYSIPVNGEYAESLNRLKKALREMPAKYFETKFGRPVMLDEFAAAVVPSDISDKTRKTLTDAGLPLFEYDPNESGSRREATMKATEGDNILFRKAYHGSGASFDRFDHSHMGEGEGAQAHGWGTYVSFNEDTAKGYATRSGRSAGYGERMAIRESIRSLMEQRDQLGERNKEAAERHMEWIRNHPEATAEDKAHHERIAEWLSTNQDPYYQGVDRAIHQRELLVNSMEYGVTYKHADIHTPLEEMEVIADAVWSLNRLSKPTRQAYLDYYRYDVGQMPEGSAMRRAYDFIASTSDEDWTSNRNLYTVEIPEDTGLNYMDEQADAKLTDVAEVWEALSQVAEDDVAVYLNLPAFHDFNHEHTGKSNEYLYQDLARILGSQKEASKLLERIGYAGIKYDGHIDGPCAVIFNDQAIQITDHIRFRRSNEEQRIFISNAEKAVSDLKMDKATPEQWKKTLEKNGGLKAAEDKWLGLSDWLDGLDRKTVTKQDVLDFIKENQIQIEETRYEEGADLTPQIEKAMEPFNAEWEELLAEGEEQTGSIFAADWVDYAWQEMIDRYGDDFELAFEVVGVGSNSHLDYISDYTDGRPGDAALYFLGINPSDEVNPINDTRLMYTTEGLENKAEIALTVPTIEPWNESDDVHFGDAGEGRAIAWVRFGDTYGVPASVDLERLQDYGRRKNMLERDRDMAQEKIDRGTTGRTREQAELDVIAAEQRLERLRNDFADVAEIQNSKVLVIDEIQSKRHQEARELGYKDEELERKAKRRGELSQKYYSDKGLTYEEHKEFKALNDELYNIGEQNVSKNSKAIPAAPFEKNWHELAMKRMLRYAAENGYEKVAWTTGEQQTERYSLSTAVDKVGVNPITKGEDKGSRIVQLYLHRSDGDYKSLVVDENGKIVQGDYSGQKLSAVVGSDLAAKIMAVEDGREEISGENLRVGGEGMKGFYDDILPRFMNKYGKKWGVKVEDIYLPNVGGEASAGLPSGLIMHSVPVTEEMKESVMQGQLMFRKADPRDRQEGESAYNFIKRSAHEFNQHYGRKKDDLVAHSAQSKNFGAYVPEIDKIVIFANEKLTTYGQFERGAFHEEIHLAMQNLGTDVDDLFDRMAARLKPETVERNLQILRDEGYENDELHNEFVTRYLESAAAFGNADRLAPEIREITDEIFKHFKYEPENEVYRRGGAEGNGRDRRGNVPATPSGEEGRQNLSDDKGTDRAETTPRNYDGEVAEESAVRFRKVEDPAKIEELENGPKVKVYRSMQEIDGQLYPPMSARVDGELREPTELGVWEESVEQPELADEDGNFKLDKGNGKSLKAAYAPYFHSRRSPLNEQFSEAYNRPNLVIVEGEIPESELTSGYTAEKSKKPVGEHDWPSGKVSNALAKKGQDTRKVILSRWFKPARVVPNSEVADMIMERMGDSKISFPYNVVTPGLREELAKKGARFSGWQGNKPADVDEQIARMQAENEQAAGETRFRKAYHGSIANFDAFDIKHAGSGEGFQAHGFGHYVAFDKDTATGYAWNNAFDYADRNGLIEPNVGDVLRNDSFDDYDSMVKRYDELLAKRKKEIADEIADEQKADPVDESMLNILQREQQALEKYAPLEEVFDGLRNIYTVEIPDDNGENYIDEMKTLAKPLRRRIADAIRAIPDARLDRTLHGPNWLPQGFKTLANVIEREQYAGLEIRRRMEDALGNTNEARKEVSRILHDAGFVGYTYEGRSDGPCAVIFSNDDIKVTSHIRFRKADDLVKRVQDYGLRGILDEDAAKVFWTDAFAVMPEEARREIVDKAFSSDADKQAIAERRYTREYIADLAKKGYAEDESGLLRHLADRLQAELGEELDENTLRYLIWRSANRYNSGIILNVAEDIALRRQLGVGEFSGDRFPSEAEQAVSEAENRIDSAEDEREASRRATRSAVRKTPFSALNSAMSGQRKYDQETVNSIVALAKDMIRKGDIDKVSAREMARLMTIIKDANGRRPATVKASALQLLDFMVDHTIGKEKELLDKMLKVRTAKVREPGVDTIAKLDLRAQNIINNFRENYQSSEEEIDRIITELDDKMADGRRTDASLEDMRSQLEGLQLAKQYAAEVTALENDIKAIRRQMKDAQEEFDKLTAEEKKQFRTALNQELAAAEEMIRSKRIEQVEAYRRLRGDLAKAINEGAERAKTFLEAERERVEQIHHWANSDMQSVPADVRDRTLTGWAKFANSSFAKLFTAPLANLDQMLRTLGRKSPEGRGYLWNWMMGAVRKASNTEKLGLDAAEKKLNARVREIFDEPDMSWNDLYAMERKMPKAKMRYFSANGEWVEEELTQGNLLYIYMVNKMSDGRMKLRQMNITEEDVENIKKNLDPRFVELADWIQEEFLPSLRDRYNETHKRLFGTSMASIENYFPLRILGGVIEEKRNVGDQEAKALPSDITGAIIKRTVNAKQLNLAGTDAFSLVVEHIREMEHWNAYAEASRDFSSLLKYKRFQNQIKQLNTVYGAGKDLLNLLWDTVNLSVGAYRPVTSPSDKNALKIAKGVTAAKISFRAYTAIKQILSWPAFLADAKPLILAKNTSPHNWAKNWKWAMENLPNFKKRVESRQAGIDILKDATFNEETWLADVERWITQNGMFMNAFVDALTVSIGARSMYETKKARYLKEGFSEEQADEKAKFDAEVLFNETQQSSENEFMSTMQANRTVWNVMWTAYRNSSMGYQRQLHQGLRTLARMARKGYKSESIEYMTKQLEREGLSPADAEKAAISRYERAGFQAAVRVAVFGWLVEFAWNLGSHAVYLLFGDDDDEKKSMFIEDATHALVGGAIEGLTMGNVISEALNMVKNGESLYNWDPTTLPIMSDVKSTISRMSSDPVAGVNDLLYLAVQIGLGTNPQTISDAIVAIYDACNGDVKMTKEAMICIMRILQVPQSQIDQFMIDEIGMTAKDARELSYEDIAKRYVDYKMNRNAPVTGPLYSDELRKKREKTLNTTFKKKYNERKKLKEEE